MRWIGFILLLGIALPTVQAQHISLKGKSLTTLKQLSQPSTSNTLFAMPLFPFSTSITPASKPTKAITTKPIPLAYAYKELAPFCKLEVKMEKIVKMPIKVRLGSVDYVDWLEGKRDWY